MGAYPPTPADTPGSTGAVRLTADLVRAEDAAELLTSYVPEDDGPAGFYRLLGFTRTGEFDRAGRAERPPPTHLTRAVELVAGRLSDPESGVRGTGERLPEEAAAARRTHG